MGGGMDNLPFDWPLLNAEVPLFWRLSFRRGEGAK
jgi:hypothetical protein